MSFDINSFVSRKIEIVLTHLFPVRLKPKNTIADF
jgi:hypothetical protein